ncbi:omega-hydroxypalmitate O-feruloyl transferase [Dorcoceras hygrometricum]|uniref:Omega-hydroxypalmitate O-feruloyl transferase n=1 Tax=Dorcoceras hygrometricum TaxID=472368 RepID=A0A2Z7AQY6_9LAMI|nr:omega-hydroxypalmitate O-feruloyl transferase [Dorcoceras hygrometricum]
MVHYDFLAGKLIVNEQSGRPEIECNGPGVGFVVASTDITMEEIGDLVYPNPAYRELIMQRLDDVEGDQPLCIFQVTGFKCGGFVLGISTNHVLFDGMSFKHFLVNLASQAFEDKSLATVPCNNRRLLAARTPPQVKFPHPELLKLKTHHWRGISQQEDLDLKIMNLSPDDVSFLKEKAKTSMTMTDGTPRPITSFNVVATHIWRCKALSRDVPNNADRLSTVLFSVDIRSRLRPKLPLSYSGNAILPAYASAKCSELEHLPFSKLVGMVSEGAGRMDDEYARSSIDWGEMYQGFPDGELLISSWWRLGFDEVVYPWGKSKYSCPVVYQRKDIILLFPEIGGTTGINVLVALPPKELHKFQHLFHKFLSPIT